MVVNLSAISFAYIDCRSGDTHLVHRLYAAISIHAKAILIPKWAFAV
jgi:hypothetical protein